MFLYNCQRETRRVAAAAKKRDNKKRQNKNGRGQQKRVKEKNGGVPPLQKAVSALRAR